jgi:hypothetical protein
VGSIFVSDFKYGMDRRRQRVAGTAGTLWTGENVVVTRGGDIERMKRFVPTYTLPAGQTFGLAEVQGQLWTFGSAPSVAVPLGINYMQCAAPSGAAMTQVLDARAVNGQLYIIARFADGNIFHFYNGGAAAYTTISLLSGASGNISNITINGVSILAVTVPFDTTLAQTASDLANQINNTSATSGYSAVASGQLVTISAAALGTTANGYAVVVTTSSINYSAAAMGGGVNASLTAASRVTDWDSVATGGFTYAVLASYLAQLINADPNVGASSVGSVVVVTARVPGTPFTISKSTTNNGVFSDQDITLSTAQANVPAAAEVLSSTVINLLAGTTGAITSVTVNGVQLLYAAVPFDTTLAQTASDLAQQIINLTATSGYTAVAGGQTVTVSALAGTGATPNGYAVVTASTGDFNIAAPAMSGGVTTSAGTAQVVTATIIGTPESVDLFTISINGTPYISTGRASATGTSLFVASKRVFSTAGSLLAWCALSSPTVWAQNAATGLAAGDGFLNVADDAEGSEPLVGVGLYLFNQAAAMTRRNIRLYNLDTDATQIGLVQPVNNTGTLAARSVLAFGSIDLFYLADSGIRSLRPRQTTNAAYMDDIGTAIDPFVQANVATLNSATVARACSVMEPLDDRYWLAVGPYIYILSYFPSAQISAWTYCNPGFSVTDFARVYNQLYVRAADTIYLYGGAAGTTYPNAGELIAYADTPFLAATPPGHFMIQGYDQAAVGEWAVSLLPNPNNASITVDIGTLDNITYSEDDTGTVGRSTHAALTFTCSAAGYAALVNMNLHDNSQEGDPV